MYLTDVYTQPFNKYVLSLYIVFSLNPASPQILKPSRRLLLVTQGESLLWCTCTSSLSLVTFSWACLSFSICRRRTMSLSPTQHKWVCELLHGRALWLGFSCGQEWAENDKWLCTVGLTKTYMDRPTLHSPSSDPSWNPNGTHPVPCTVNEWSVHLTVTLSSAGGHLL
jgi:hypothetical protein